MRISDKCFSVVAISLLSTVCFHAIGGEVSYNEEYQNRIKSAGALQPLGDAPFGEAIDLYTGATSFALTDLVLEGKGPAIRVMRKSTQVDFGAENVLQFGGFGDWELEIPYIETIVPATVQIDSTVGIWKTLDNANQPTTARCTNFGEMWTPPDRFYGVKSITAPASSWWVGYTLKIPGLGSQPILARGSTAPTPATGNYPGVTLQHWQIGCQAGVNVTNGEEGEGFVVLAPDGTKYFMTHLSYSMYATYIEQDPMGAQYWARVPRNVARMKATRVEDRFGNFITYGYTGDKLTSITGSDGRSVTIQWWPDSPLIQSVTSNGRTWQYAYASRSAAGGTLSQVTLPDNSTWIYTGSVSSRSGYPVSITGCMPGNIYPLPGSSSGITSTYTAKNPSGLLGTFRFSYRLRAQSYMGSGCESDPWSQTYYETANPFFLVSSLVERELSGPGMSNALWTYTYEVAHASAQRDCPNNSCQSTTYTDVVEPGGGRTRYIHTTRYGALQGKLLRTEIYNGAQMLRSEDRSYNYAESDMPYPSTFGDLLYVATPSFALDHLVLMRKAVVAQQARSFVWEIPAGCPNGLTGYCFDAFGRPTTIEKSGAPSP